MSALRAVLRIAVRDALRARGRTALLAVMVLVPVLIASAVSVVVRSQQLEPADEVTVQLGADPGVQALVRWTGDAGPIGQGPLELAGPNVSYAVYGRVFADGTSVPVPDPQKVAATVGARFAATGHRAVPQVRTTYQSVVAGSRVAVVDVVEVDLPALGGAGPYRLMSGRWPAAASEVVVSGALERRTGIATGARIRYASRGAAPKEYTVVGQVTGSRLDTVAELFGAPGSLLPPVRSAEPLAGGGWREYSWFVLGSSPVTWRDVQAANQDGVLVLSRAVVADPPEGVPSGPAEMPVHLDGSSVTVAVLVALLLLQIGLLVGPAVAVGARRNERMLALVAATGGNRGHLAAVVVTGAAVVALGAGLAGAVLGAAAGAAAVPSLPERFDWVAPRADVVPGDLVAFVVAAVLVAVAAAVLPALRVARQDPVAVLAGRRARAVPRLRVPKVVLLVLAVGAAVGWAGASAGIQAAAVLGLGVLEVGLVLLAPLAVGATARLAPRLPLAARFAARDAARQGARTVPAVAATLAAVGATACVIVYAQADAGARRDEFRLRAPLGSVIVPLDVGGPLTAGGTGAAPVSAQAVADRVRAVLPVTAASTVYRGGTSEDPAVGYFAKMPMRCSGGGDTCGFRSIDTRFVDPADVAALASDPAPVREALAAGRAVTYDPRVVAANGTVALSLAGPVDERVVTLPVTLLRGEKLNGVWIPTTQAERLGVILRPDTLVVRPERPVTDADLQRLGADLVALDPAINASVQEGFREYGRELLLVPLALALLVALVGTFTAVGLAAADARPDLATLSAVGADPGVRRRVGAAQAGAIAVPGAVLGVAGGIVGGWILVRLNSSGTGYYAGYDWSYAVPPLPTLALLLGLPLLAVALGWLTVRSRLATPGRVVR